MRPVLLDMDGFASFRDQATVDFTDADYFALVGPTGSGKSTVIDAMTFALYGTVPRWQDKRMVMYALAPTAVRGTVRLVFDVERQDGMSSPESCDGRKHGGVQHQKRSAGKASRSHRHRHHQRPDGGDRRRRPGHRRRREAVGVVVRALLPVRGAAAG